MMEKNLILYPAFMMVSLTFFLYLKNYLDNLKATKKREISFSHFKAYSGPVPEYIDVSRQTLKNQFELPILFYFLVSIVFAMDNASWLDVMLSWIFVFSRFVHCYIRLTTNYVPYRAIAFEVGVFTAAAWMIKILFNIV
tara:strand:+ start:557 stop:973 length:417 start_codon:yes stop_codon:yes gene_type:complete